MPEAGIPPATRDPAAMDTRLVSPTALPSRVLKVTWQEPSVRGEDRDPPTFVCTPFPGMAGPHLIGALSAWVPVGVTGPLGIQVRPDGGRDEDFGYVNLVDEATLAGMEGRCVRVLFHLSIPDSWVKADVLVPPLGRHDGHRLVARITQAGGHLACFDPEGGPLPASLPAAAEYFFVVGAPKSGTTWLEAIVNSHPDALCLGQGDFFRLSTGPQDLADRYRDPASRRVPPGRALARWWVARLTGTTRAPWQHARAVYNHWLPAAASEDDYGVLRNAAGVEWIFRTILQVWPVHVIGDRSPSYSPLQAYLMPLRAFPRARLIHIRRHPLDVVVSRVFHEVNLLRAGSGYEFDRRDLARLRLAAESEDGGARLPLARHPKLVARILNQWLTAEELFDEARGRYPDRVLAVSYESLVHDFEDTVSGCFRFLGLDTDEPILAQVRAATDFRAMSGGRPSGSQDASSFFRKGVAGDHRNHFTAEHIRRWNAYLARRRPGWASSLPAEPSGGPPSSLTSP